MPVRVGRQHAEERGVPEGGRQRLFHRETSDFPTRSSPTPLFSLDPASPIAVHSYQNSVNWNRHLGSSSFGRRGLCRRNTGGSGWFVRPSRALHTSLVPVFARPSPGRSFSPRGQNTQLAGARSTGPYSGPLLALPAGAVGGHRARSSCPAQQVSTRPVSTPASRFGVESGGHWALPSATAGVPSFRLPPTLPSSGRGRGGSGRGQGKAATRPGRVTRIILPAPPAAAMRWSEKMHTNKARTIGPACAGHAKARMARRRAPVLTHTWPSPRRFS